MKFDYTSDLYFHGGKQRIREKPLILQGEISNELLLDVSAAYAAK